MSANSPGPVEQFVAFVRRRVNIHLLWTTLIWTAAVGAGLLATVSLVYVVQGYAVPGGWVAASLLVAAVGGVAAWFWRRMNVEQAARFVDRFYGLKDAVASHLHFSRAGRRDGFYELQADYTRRQVSELSPAAIAILAAASRAAARRGAHGPRPPAQSPRPQRRGRPAFGARTSRSAK